MGQFEQELCDYFQECGAGICVERVNRSLYVIRCEGKGLAVITVPLLYFEEGGSPEELMEVKRTAGGEDVLCLYEDRWRSSGPLVRSMLQVRLGMGSRVFARNCEVREIGTEAAAVFLERNHLYGHARARYRFGLFRFRSTGAGEATMDSTQPLVAVAAFSKGREMTDGTMSYEWVRYASVRGVRIVGGMGRLLDAFVMDRTCKDCPGAFEVMTYCDLEWYDGRSYHRLGFEDAGLRPPVAFMCPVDGGRRIHEGKLTTDRRFRHLLQDGSGAGERMVRILNTGSRKLILRCGV